ncbi:hypothetical protein [Streptomyces fructofermentans]|uniref:hypothetical protein n=1 Tax=Streptomyces fructofermentans TaxID=152141 RepID=UPI0033C067A6
MSDQSQKPAVEIPDVRRLLLVETAPPRPTVERGAAMARGWKEAVAANPSLFDGPTAVCAGLEQKDPHTLLLTWSRATQPRYLIRSDIEAAELGGRSADFRYTPRRPGPGKEAADDGEAGGRL